MIEGKEVIGRTASACVTVDTAHTARAVGSGALAVYATPMMVALMENAACNVLADLLAEGQTSVGTAIHVNHIAATPTGAVVTATATLVAANGKKVEFDISARDGEREIGNARHTRVIVDAARFMERACGGRAK